MPFSLRDCPSAPHTFALFSSEGPDIVGGEGENPQMRSSPSGRHDLHRPRIGMDGWEALHLA
ncbi:hypothetical protein [Streptomyces sp. NPDC051561]|uniref:hypothetical protein n=1 Tax=Streptomyces sp. NPDC051561 TaxID=3365658 RepID=UPI00379783DD